MHPASLLWQRKDLRGKYRNPNGTFTAAAIRARKPFAGKNALVGTGLLGFCAFCYWWAYRSFLPDDFGDVPVPPISEEQLSKLKKSKA